MWPLGPSGYPTLFNDAEALRMTWGLFGANVCFWLAMVLAWRRGRLK